MGIDSILVMVEGEITKLNKAKKILLGLNGTQTRGRHVMTAAARRKISLAQKKRWREQRKAA